MDPDDRTVVLDHAEVQKDETLLNFTDFGGQDVYENTYPLFLKSRNQAVLLAVKLPNYS